jgi:hypothetical protein
MPAAHSPAGGFSPARPARGDHGRMLVCLIESIRNRRFGIAECGNISFGSFDRAFESAENFRESKSRAPCHPSRTARRHLCARPSNFAHAPRKRTRPNRGIRQRFSLDFVTPAASRRCRPDALASSLLSNRAAELHRLMRNFLAASAESDSSDDGDENDSALHGYIS